jgi:peptidoglycan/LPS O-acetylase OafA/YrhL
MLVFSAHTFWSGNGWQGVHLFFVLSGFLITGILRRSSGHEMYWSAFYIKRATRIIPPLLIFFVFAILLYSPPWKVLSAYLFFGANIISVTHYDLRNAFDVLWSLSVEEHFYLFWPIAVRFCSRAALIRLSAGICLAEPVLRLAFTRVFHDAQPIYMLTPFQLDGLAAGSLLALLFEEEAMRRLIGRWCGAMFWASCAMYVSLSLASHSFVFSADSFLFNGGGTR